MKLEAANTWLVLMPVVNTKVTVLAPVKPEPVIRKGFPDEQLTDPSTTELTIGGT